MYAMAAQNNSFIGNKVLVHGRSWVLISAGRDGGGDRGESLELFLQ